MPRRRRPGNPSTARFAAAMLLVVPLARPAETFAAEVPRGLGEIPADGLSDLRRPPSPLPADMPRLPPVLTDASEKTASSAQEWERRRSDIEARWKAFLGELPAGKVPLETEVLQTEELPSFSRKRVRYRVEAGVTTDGYLLEPKGVGDPGEASASKRPGAVVFHATAPAQAKQPAGLEPARPELAIGVHLVERGFVVLCPRCYIFAEGADYVGNVETARARHPGWKGMTRMVLDAVRAADFLESIPTVDSKRLACIGHSLGAKEALYAAAFDARYRAAVFSEGGIGLAFSNWDAVWYLGPGIRAPDFPREHHELIALIAPRAFLLLAGDSADGARSWAFIDAALPVYRLLGVEDRIGWLRHGDGHSYSPAARAAAEAFLERWTR